ncbi:bifunctional diguanylate cyclase/phosphodiesterase [Thioalkalivibrio sp. ALgr3]|uniref:putative bifunctional diguanylate cyclase/phosphodiesterase n=1 Tax=Thioalkalivibrio sp. ALgr3 TaxID=1239292 RepID=UPI00036CD1DF|nr:EAL domain-containing protein [Thioalkalivibrio sp. ALgr3]
MNTDEFEIFPWGDEFLTRIPEVDRQHHYLVDLINRLARTVLEGTDEATADGIVAELRDYARYHFETEEGIWARAFQDDEWFARHCQAHAGFIDELDRIAALEGPEEYRLQPLLEFLVRWLTLHILRSDKQMAAAINALEAGVGVAEARERAARHFREQSPSSLESLLNTYVHIERQVSQFAKQLASRGQEEAENRFRTLFDCFIHPLLILDAEDGSILDANPAACRMTGHAEDELKQRPITDLHPDDERERIAAHLTAPPEAPAGHENPPLYSRVRTATQRDVPVRITRGGELRDHGRRLRVAFYEDMTRELEHRRELEWRSFNDPLTGLPNRAGIMQALEQVTTEHDDTALALISIDVDDFGALNNRLGTAAGDRILAELSRRWRERLNDDALLGRRGGDDFILVLRSSGAIERLEEIMGTVIEAGHHLPVSDKGPAGASENVSVSAGISIRPPRSGLDPETVLRQADHALYESKLRRDRAWEYFDHGQYQRVASRHRTINAFRQAMHRNELSVEYQPKVNMRTGTILGVEALVRWRHPDHGLLTPGEFLPTIENDPVSIELGEYMLEEAMRQMEAWRAAGRHLPVSVNIGALQLESGDLPRRLENILDRHPDIPRGDLEIEVLESTAFDNAAAAEANMRAVRELGVSMSIDDFGTGYSSLTYIKRVPANALKMDRSYVRDMLEDADDRAIIEAVVGLARAFDRLVLAEGVETVEQGRILIGMGCENGQGYAIARPLPPDALEGWLEHWTPPTEWSAAPAPA